MRRGQIQPDWCRRAVNLLVRAGLGVDSDALRGQSGFYTRRTSFALARRRTASSAYCCTEASTKHTGAQSPAPGMGGFDISGERFFFETTLRRFKIASRYSHPAHQSGNNGWHAHVVVYYTEPWTVDCPSPAHASSWTAPAGSRGQGRPRSRGPGQSRADPSIYHGGYVIRLVGRCRVQRSGAGEGRLWAVCEILSRCDTLHPGAQGPHVRDCYTRGCGG